MKKTICFLISLILIAGCTTANTLLKTESRNPSSQVCNAECIVQDMGWVPNLFRLLGARLGPVEAADFPSLVRQCSQLADAYMKQNAETLLEKSARPVYQYDIGFYFIS